MLTRRRRLPLYPIVTASQPLGSRMTSDDGATIDVGEVARADRGCLLLDGADDHEAARAVARLPADRGDRGRERPLGVDGAASMQKVAVAADVDVTRDGVDVPDQRDRLGAVTPRRRRRCPRRRRRRRSRRAGASRPAATRRHPPGRSRWARDSIAVSSSATSTRVQVATPVPIVTVRLRPQPERRARPRERDRRRGRECRRR